MTNELLAISFGFTITAIIIGTIAILVSIMAFTKVQAMEKSTHKIEYVPLDQYNNIVDTHSNVEYGEVYDGLEEFDKAHEEDPTIPLSGEDDAYYAKMNRESEKKEKKLREFGISEDQIDEDMDFNGTNW